MCEACVLMFVGLQRPFQHESVKNIMLSHRVFDSAFFFETFVFEAEVPDCIVRALRWSNRCNKGFSNWNWLRPRNKCSS